MASSGFTDPYTYPNTNTLANKPGLRDPEALKDFEYEQSALRVAEMRATPIVGEFDLKHLAAIHAHIFQDTYDWAGKPRVINLSKGGTSFASPITFNAESKRLSDSLAAERGLRGLDKPNIVDRLAHYYAKWNALHPFREGNGRSTREFIGQMARQAGYELDQTRIDNSKDQWNLAAKRSISGDLESVKEIFAQAIRPTRAIAFEKLPEAEALVQHPELKGAYASLRAVQHSIEERYAGNDQAQSHFGAQARIETIRRLDSGHVPPVPLMRESAARDSSGPSFSTDRAPDRLLIVRDIPPPEPPARAKAFQAVADRQLSRDDALKFYPELRPAFNQLVIAKLQNADNPQPVKELRESLQAVLNAGQIPAPARPGLQPSRRHEHER